MSGARGSTSISGDVSGAEGGSGASVAFVGSTEAAAALAALRRLRLSASGVRPDFLPIAPSCVPFLRAEVAARLGTTLVQVWHHGRKLHQSSAEPGMRHLGAGRYTKRQKPNRMASTCPTQSGREIYSHSEPFPPLVGCPQGPKKKGKKKWATTDRSTSCWPVEKLRV